MKQINLKRWIVFSFCLGAVFFAKDINAQIGGFEGNVEINMNSTSTNPHLLLRESTTNDYSRVHFRNDNAPNDYWALGGRVGTSPIIGYFYNGTIKAAYSENDSLFYLYDGGLFADAEGTVDPIRVRTNGGTKFRIFASPVANTATLGSNWNVPEDNVFRIAYDRTYVKDSLQLKAPGQDPAVELTRTDGIKVYDGTDRNFYVNLDGDIDVDGTSSLSGLVTTFNDIQMRGTDPRIEFWDPLGGAGVGAEIIYDYDSNGNGNFSDFIFRNNDVVGEFVFQDNTLATILRMSDTNIWAYQQLAPWTHKAHHLGSNGKAWDNVYYDDLVNQGAAAFASRNVTEELVNYPPIEKKPGDFDYMTERGEIEMDPNFLPPGLMEDNGILTDEMTSYNYKANYEQQLQINELKRENEELKAQIQLLLEKLD